MASTNKTSNFKLNQWVLSDPVLMEDFNADNQKIETALFESANTLEKLRNSSVFERLAEVEITQSGIKNVTIDLSGIDLTKYQHLRLCRDMIASTPREPTFFLRINNLSSGYYYRGSGTSWTWGALGNLTTLTYGYADFFISGSNNHVYWGDWLWMYYNYVTTVTPRTLTSINLMMNENASSDFTVGDRFTLLGVKK